MLILYQLRGERIELVSKRLAACTKSRRAGSKRAGGADRAVESTGAKACDGNVDVVAFWSESFPQTFEAVTLQRADRCW